MNLDFEQVTKKGNIAKPAAKIFRLTS